MINSENSTMQFAEFNTTVFDFDLVFILINEFLIKSVQFQWFQSTNYKWDAQNIYTKSRETIQ